MEIGASTAVLYHLAGVRWDLFSGLTFVDPVPARSTRLTAFHALMRHDSLRGSATLSPLWVLREELGERTSRPHLHFLWASNAQQNLITLAYRLQSRWLEVAGAFAKIRRYDQRRAGVAYVCKCLGWDSAANAYEAGKFQSADSVTFSHSLVALIRSRNVIEERRAARVAAKRGRAESTPQAVGSHDEAERERSLQKALPPAVGSVAVCNSR